MQRVDVTIQGHAMTLLGSIPGFVPDGEAVRAALEELQPAIVALGIPPEDLPALETLAQSDDPTSLIPDREAGLDLGHGAPGLEATFIDTTEDLPDDVGFPALDPVHAHLLRLLGRFAPTRLPSPDLEAAYGFAQAHGLDVIALDMDDEAHAEVYVQANRLWDVLRGNRHTKKLLARTFDDAADPAALVQAFDAAQNRLPSLQVVEEAREAHMARRLEAAARGGLVALIPLARLAGVVASLAQADPSSTPPDSPPQ